MSIHTDVTITLSDNEIATAMTDDYEFGASVVASLSDRASVNELAKALHDDPTGDVDSIIQFLGLLVAALSTEHQVG